MQLSKFKPGGLVIARSRRTCRTRHMRTHAASALPTQVIGSLASAVAKAPAHVTVVKNTWWRERAEHT